MMAPKDGPNGTGMIKGAGVPEPRIGGRTGRNDGVCGGRPKEKPKETAPARIPWG